MNNVEYQMLISYQLHLGSALTWFIRNIYYWNSGFLNIVIIIKTKVLQTSGIDNLLADLGFFAFLFSKDLIYLGFQSFGFDHTWWNVSSTLN
jgi:hypothetical protein